MEIPRGSVIVSRCSLKYIKDQTSCEGGKRERERERDSKREDIATVDKVLGFSNKEKNEVWVSGRGLLFGNNAPVCLRREGMNQLIRVMWRTGVAEPFNEGDLKQALF